MEEVVDVTSTSKSFLKVQHADAAYEQAKTVGI